MYCTQGEGTKIQKDNEFSIVRMSPVHNPAGVLKELMLIEGLKSNPKESFAFAQMSYLVREIFEETDHEVKLPLGHRWYRQQQQTTATEDPLFIFGACLLVKLNRNAQVKNVAGEWVGLERHNREPFISDAVFHNNARAFVQTATQHYSGAQVGDVAGVIAYRCCRCSLCAASWCLRIASVCCRPLKAHRSWKGSLSGDVIGKCEAQLNAIPYYFGYRDTQILVEIPIKPNCCPVGRVGVTLSVSLHRTTPVNPSACPPLRLLPCASCSFLKGLAGQTLNPSSITL